MTGANLRTPEFYYQNWDYWQRMMEPRKRNGYGLRRATTRGVCGTSLILANIIKLLWLSELVQFVYF